MSTFITRLDENGDGPRVAVKDLIDVSGVPTTAGSRAVERIALPAVRDAVCVAALRSSGARIAGKANLHELAWGGTGMNPWFGTPENPLDPSRIPGGSSSGSAVAVATGEVEVALGTDTGGSVRIPSACCGIAGLKTTFGRISLEGVWPLAPSLDTVGPMAADVAGVVLGMRLLEPGFELAGTPSSVGRVRGLPGVAEEVEAAVDAALVATGLEVIDLELHGWRAATQTALTVMMAEAWRVNRRLIESDPGGIGDEIRSFFVPIGAGVGDAALAALLATARAWRAELDSVLGQVGVIALPTLPRLPPHIGQEAGWIADHTAAVNLGGHPALALPVPGPGLPVSVQLVAAHHCEDVLLALGAALEAAVAA